MVADDAFPLCKNIIKPFGTPREIDLRKYFCWHCHNSRSFSSLAIAFMYIRKNVISDQISTIFFFFNWLFIFPLSPTFPVIFLFFKVCFSLVLWIGLSDTFSSSSITSLSKMFLLISSYMKCTIFTRRCNVIAKILTDIAFAHTVIAIIHYHFRFHLVINDAYLKKLFYIPMLRNGVKIWMCEKYSLYVNIILTLFIVSEMHDFYNQNKVNKKEFKSLTQLALYLQTKTVRIKVPSLKQSLLV